MNKEDYDFWINNITFILTIIAIIIACLAFVSAEDNTTVIINNTYVLNNTYTINNTYNQTYNYSYYYNVTTNYTYYNFTNITTCVNCTTNITNYYNGSNFVAGDYYVKGDVDTKINNLNNNFNNYILKSDFSELVNATNSTSLNWTPADTYITVGMGITFLIAAVALGLIVKAGME